MDWEPKETDFDRNFVKACLNHSHLYLPLERKVSSLGRKFHSQVPPPMRSPPWRSPTCCLQPLAMLGEDSFFKDLNHITGSCWNMNATHNNSTGIHILCTVPYQCSHHLVGVGGLRRCWDNFNSVWLMAILFVLLVLMSYALVSIFTLGCWWKWKWINMMRSKPHTCENLLAIIEYWWWCGLIIPARKCSSIAYQKSR